MLDRTALARYARWAKQMILRADVGILTAAAAMAFCGYGLFWVIGEVVEGDTQRMDERIVYWIEAHPAPPQFEEFMRDCTAFGGAYVLILVTLAVGGFLLIRRERNALLFLLLSVGGAFALSLSLKYFFDRDRPQILEHRSHTITKSFPSGHAMLSAAVWLTLGVMLSRLEKSRYLKSYFILIGLLIALLTGISRVYLGVHWPTDVLAGWMAGTAWAILCFFVIRYNQYRGRIEPPAEHGVEAGTNGPDDVSRVPIGASRAPFDTAPVAGRESDDL